MKGVDGEGYYDSEAGSLTLVNIALDLQIIICTFLHPSDILALRKTCKTLQLLTRQRVVWVAALRRVCLDNSLFLPSFPILDMSDAELEHAATGPRRWIELSTAPQNQRPDGSDETLHPRTIRFIEDSSVLTEAYPELSIVPGGRYMVSYSDKGIHVWDLGYTSSSDCKLIASVELEYGKRRWQNGCMVQVTPDGMGLILLSALYENWSIYVIYPHSETPQLIRIAHLDPPTGSHPYPDYLLDDRVFWNDIYQNMIVFGVWDYRLNHSIQFSGGVDISRLGSSYEMIATKTAIIILCGEEMLVWAIPPLIPQLPDFSDYNLAHIPLLFSMAFPDGVVNHDKLAAWISMSQWYSGSSQPLYFDILCRDSILHGFEIIIKPDVFDTSLHLISTEVPHDFGDVSFEKYNICEDTLVTCWFDHTTRRSGVYTGLTTSRFTTVLSHGGPAVKILFPTPGWGYSLCPASGRYLYLKNGINGIFVVDLF